MTLRKLIVAAALIAYANPAPAQEVSGRLDLEAIAPLPHVQMVAVHVTFVKDDVACPEDFGMMRISAAGWRHNRPLLPRRSLLWGAITTPPDDKNPALSARGPGLSLRHRYSPAASPRGWKLGLAARAQEGSPKRAGGGAQGAPPSDHGTLEGTADNVTL